jgi:hypothetical protein
LQVLFGGETGEDAEDKLKEEKSAISKSEMFLPMAPSKRKLAYSIMHVQAKAAFACSQ